jgi:hypothetical protein
MTDDGDDSERTLTPAKQAARESEERLHATLERTRERCRRVSEMCLRAVQSEIRPPAPGTTDCVDMDRARAAIDASAPPTARRSMQR